MTRTVKELVDKCYYRMYPVSSLLTEPDLLLVLLEDVQLVSELLGGLQRHGEQQQHVIDPGDHTLRLVSVKPEQEFLRCEKMCGQSLPRHPLVSDHVIDSKYQFP